MNITSVRLQNYRSYKDMAFEFDPSVNIIVGPNASGKTNLLDALHVVSSAVSMKLSRERMVRVGADWARIDALTNTNQKRVVKMSENDQKLIFEIDGKQYRRVPHNQKIPVVLFEPSQLFYITTSPEMRRSLLDDILAKTSDTYICQKNEYQKVLRQRNALLKQSLNQIQQQIFAWDIRLSELAGYIVKQRLNLVESMNERASSIYSDIAKSNHEIVFSYESKIPISTYNSSLLKYLQVELETDQRRGFTGAGPHRDDVRISIDGEDMRDVASRGETRSILLMIKIIEGSMLEESFNQKPLLLLDDVFGELDGVRRKSLIEHMSGYQTFITTTDADVISHRFASQAHVISF